jgi:hypothetical protein
MAASLIVPSLASSGMWYVRLGRTLVKNGIYILSSFCKYLTLKFLHSASLPGLLIKGTSTFSEKVQSGTLQNG